MQSNLSGESIVKHNNTFMQAMFNFLKSFIGIGVISISSRVEHSGIILAFICMLFSALLSLVGTNLTVLAREKVFKDDRRKGIFVSRKSAEIGHPQRLFQSENLDHERLSLEESDREQLQPFSENDKLSMDTHDLIMENNYIKAYAEMGMKWYGLTGYRFWTLILLSQQLIVLTAYMSFYDEYFEAYAMLGALIPLWMFLDLKQISYFSTISICFILSSLWIILGISISDIPETNYDDLKYLEFFEFPLFFGSSIFMFEGDVVAMNIQDSMKKPRDFRKLSIIGLGIVTVFWSILWIVPYYAYGNGISDPLIESISVHWVRSYLKVAYTIAIGFGAPLMVYPIWEIFYRSEIWGKEHLSIKINNFSNRSIYPICTKTSNG